VELQSLNGISYTLTQYELIGVFQVGDGPHVNNIELGRYGRNRSNLWTYAGVNGFGSGRLEYLHMHPTVKPTSLIVDAMRDCSVRGDIILDTFAGSGSTLIACEKVGRRGYGIEIEPRYVDVTIRRWEAVTKADAVLEGDGRTFAEINAERIASLATNPAQGTGRTDRGISVPTAVNNSASNRMPLGQQATVPTKSTT